MLRGRRLATRDDKAGADGARHSLTSWHASSGGGRHGLLHRVAPHAAAGGARWEGLAIAGELLAGVGKRLAGLLERGLWWLRGMRRRGKAAKRGLRLPAVERLVIHGSGRAQ